MMKFGKSFQMLTKQVGGGGLLQWSKSPWPMEPKKSKLHINQLELKAALLAVKCFASEVQDVKLFSE